MSDQGRVADPETEAGSLLRTGEAKPDLSFLLPMIERVRAVEIRFQDGAPGSGIASTDLQPLAALQARVQLLEQEIQGLRRGLEEIASALNRGPGALPASGLLAPVPCELLPQSPQRLAIGAALAVGLLLAAHWLVVVLFDLHTVVLRLVSVAIPLAVGVALTWHRDIRLRAEAAVALAIGVLSVLAMSYVTSVVEGTAVLPGDLREWRETVEYVASISLAYVTGVLLSSAWQAHRGVQHRVGVSTLRLAQAIAQLTGKAVATGPELNSQLASIQELINKLALVSAGAASLVTALRGLTG